MRIRRERTLQDLSDVTPTLSQPQITPVMRRNIRMHGPNDEANSGSLTNMVTSENSSHCSGRNLKVDYRGKSGTCNVCSAPCSSCFHVNKVLLKSNNEHAGETCGGNTETGTLSILSTVGGMDSTADSFSENAAGKACSRSSNASASDDSVMHSKCDGRRSPEGHDDCLSCVSGTDEQLNRKSDTEDSGNKYNKQSSGEISRKMSPSSSQTRIYSQNPAIVGFSVVKSTDDATDLLNAQNISNKASGDKNLPHEGSLNIVNDDKPSDAKVEPLKGSTEHLNTSSPNGVASDNDCGDPSKMDLNSIEKNDDEMDIELHPADESDDSEMVEDVKVCDICGDAGREDLLAICSRCSDGAEHTYCMRKRLEKVPEGEWFCEECKATDLVGNGKKEKIGSIDNDEKNNSSGRLSENLNDSDGEGQRTKSSTKVLSKRPRDDEDAEVSSIAKKPSLESTVGSPKTSNSKLAVLSRESSLKSLDKGRLQSPKGSTSETVPVNDATEMAKPASDVRGLHVRGTFSKSNSFNSLNSKPKVKLVDQVVIQRQKSAKEHGSFRLKEGASRSIGKSMSFRSTNSNRSESKTKMVSPRPSHFQDVKITKERSTFERQRSFRTDHQSNNLTMGTSVSSTSKIDKKPSFREPSSLAPTTNHHEVKPVMTDGKSAALSRSSSLAARKNADVSNSTGEFKRPSKHCHSTAVVSSANGVANTEQKHSQSNLRQDSAAPGISEKLSVKANESISDGLVQSKDLADSAGRPREYSGSRLGPPYVRSSRDEGDNLKAAIEAAVLRKPGVYRKNRASAQSDESSVPTVAPIASHIDHMSSARSRMLSSDGELAERPPVSRSLTSDPLKEESPNGAKLPTLVRTEGLSSVGRDGSHIGLASRDTLSNVSAAMSLLLKSIAIPQHEHIWQGSFLICRSGQTELSDGIQAHLSTCASPKVIEAVNRFQNKIVLNEVPRVSIWPVQFHDNGVRDDNIALFFFAKDLQSHEKIYKVLLDNMMKNDLALRGNINGVELLIFPSNQLPIHMQRWNTIFFLWGVFRGKKELSPRHMPESITPRYVPPPIMSLPENRCSLGPITENASQDVHPGLEVTGSEDLRSSPRVVNGDVGINASPLDKLGDGLNSIASSAVQSDGAKQCREVKDVCQEGGICSSSTRPVATTSSCSGSEPMLTEPDAPLMSPHSPNNFSKVVAATPMEGTSDGAILESACHQNEPKLRKEVIDLSKDASEEEEEEEDGCIRDLNVEPSSWLFAQKEPMLPGPASLGNHTRIESVRTLENVNHLPTTSYALQSQHSETGIRLNPKLYNNGEIFFPVQPEPVKVSMPWKTHLPDDDRLSDRAPNLELALGAERKPPSLGIEPLLFTQADHKLREERILEEARKKVEEDVSASLSLSLSFPFPEKEVDAKPEQQQHISQRKHVNTSSRLLFGNFREK